VKKLILLLMMIVVLVGCAEVKETIKDDSTAPVLQSGKEMLVHFIDVGQGDAIFIQSPNGKTMLVDGGVKGEGTNVVSYLREQGIEQLDYVVATHPDADHIGGLIAVLNSISIKHFLDSGKVHTSQTYEEMISLISQKNIPYTVPKTGDHVKLDEALDITVLHADEDASDNNEASIVLKVVYNNVSFLLTGDAGIDVEEEMLYSEDVSATVLKAGHHGSNTSSSPAFIAAVDPEAAILSYGQDNKYGHPHFEVVESLQQAGSKIYGTAESGHIVIETDGHAYLVNADEWTGVGATSSIPARSQGKVEIISKDLEKEIVSVKNSSEKAINMTGWQLVSVEGNQVFEFPDFTLKPGEIVKVVSGPDAVESKGTLKWTNRQIWLNAGDAAKLQNAKGEVVSELE
jgi:competence protein ComEC